MCPQAARGAYIGFSVADIPDETIILSVAAPIRGITVQGYTSGRHEVLTMAKGRWQKLPGVVAQLQHCLYCLRLGSEQGRDAGSCWRRQEKWRNPMLLYSCNMKLGRYEVLMRDKIIRNKRAI
ncbi:hypothetical protein GCM10027202_18210 [Microvirgula curvata]